MEGKTKIGLFIFVLIAILFLIGMNIFRLKNPITIEKLPVEQVLESLEEENILVFENEGISVYEGLILPDDIAIEDYLPTIPVTADLENVLDSRGDYMRQLTMDYRIYRSYDYLVSGFIEDLNRKLWDDVTFDKEASVITAIRDEASITILLNSDITSKQEQSVIISLTLY